MLNICSTIGISRNHTWETSCAWAPTNGAKVLAHLLTLLLHVPLRNSQKIGINATFHSFIRANRKRNKVLVEFLNSEKCYHLKPNRTVERSLKKDLKTELRTVDWHSQSKRNGHSSRGKCFQHLRSGISGWVMRSMAIGFVQPLRSKVSGQKLCKELRRVMVTFRHARNSFALTLEGALCPSCIFTRWTKHSYHFGLTWNMWLYVDVKDKIKLLTNSTYLYSRYSILNGVTAHFVMNHLIQKEKQPSNTMFDGWKKLLTPQLWFQVDRGRTQKKQRLIHFSVGPKTWHLKVKLRSCGGERLLFTASHVYQ